ncbi:AMP-binding protein [Verminephrobacter eiseniae]|uniref:AMP-binding protein n=1 Tax=Verminephrobacter eiseniae TaxID=364317 RepID=UPI002238235B|nr:AMP-binding protein [Verminephrobacter eiseniae]
MDAVARSVGGEVRERFSLSRWTDEVRTVHGGGELPLVDPRDLAQVQYTSGTTGQPKGALLHHMGLVTNASYVAQRLGLERDVLVSPMPLFHTAGSVLSSLGCVTTCSTYVLPVVFDPKLILDAVQRHRGGVLFGVPTMFIALLDQARRQDYDLTSLRVASSGGAPVPPELQRRVRDGLGCELLLSPA